MRLSTDWPVPVGEVIAAPIRQVLLVAGPSGSGKSTFLKQLRSGRLPEEIKAELPPGCESWRKINLHGFIPFFEAWPRSERVDIVIHYDTMRAHNAGWSSFFEDPRLHAIAQADIVVAVTLRPTLDQLWAQYGRKVFGDETRAQTLGALRRAKLSAAHTHILRYLAEKTNQVLRPSKPFPKPKRPSPPRANITALYQQPDGLETWSRRWDDLVAFLASNGPLTKEIAVAPTGEPYQDRDRGWTLLKVTVPPKGDTEPPRP